MAATLTISAVPGQTAGVSFKVSATLQIQPAYQFHDDTGTFVALPSGATAAAATAPLSFTHPGLPAGTHTIALRDSVTGATASTSVTVTAPATGHAVKIMPGQSVTTADGHTWGVDANENADWDGAAVPGGGGTGEGAYDATVGGSAGTKYGQDASSGNWWTWDTVNGWVEIAPAVPNFGTAPPPVAGPGHGPLLQTPANAQSFPGRSNGTNWGNILVSTGISVDTQVGIQFGNINYIACECNSPGQAEFGRPGEIKMLYSGGVVAVFFRSGVVLGSPDVQPDAAGHIFYNAEGWSDPAFGGMIWRYAGGPVPAVINDWDASRGDVLNIRGDYQAAGATVTHPTSTDTLVQIHFDGGSVYIYNHTLNASDIVWN